MKVIGISCWYHDSAVAFIEDGLVISAVQEERFTRKKHDPNFPINALLWTLEEFKLDINNLDYIAYYEDPRLKLSRIKYTHAIKWPKSFYEFKKDIKSQEQKVSIERFLRKKLNFFGKFYICKHHLSHAASAFYPSPFSEAAFLTIDGVGEYETTTFGVAKDKKISITERINFPHSLGLLYSAFTYYCGFKINSGEYKLMGLAPYGRPLYAKKIMKNMIDLKDDGSFRLDMKYFGHLGGQKAITSEFEKLLQRTRRFPETEITEFYMDVASSIQMVLEDIFLKICQNVKEKTSMDNLCLAGGVALNCVANGKLLSSNIFKRIWIQPASGDAGGAIGAALYCSNILSKNRALKKYFMNPYLGPSFNDDEIKYYLDENNIPYKKSKDVAKDAAAFINEGNILGWFQGSAEFGPRALGNRSILGNPLLANMQREINLKVKYRESFRPFAPVILEEKVNDWFEIETPSPYMLLVSQVKKNKLIPVAKEEKGFKKLNTIRSLIPAITHVDYSARIQTVNNENNPLLYNLVKEFEKISGCPILINTSFNVRGEPIVLTAEDAYKCFIRTKIDYLILGSYIISKKDLKYKIEFSEENLESFPLD
tara:strand:- start:838 stop:2628 length:1791 start_codon:yes stop_codon:yes gene_type:complete